MLPIDQVSRDIFTEFDRLFSTQRPNRWASQTPIPLDAWRDENNVYVQADIPGVREEDVDITVDGDTITIHAERAQEAHDGVMFAAERLNGRFVRRVSAGIPLDAEAADARYEHGVLTITVPVASHAKPRKVSIGGRHTSLNSGKSKSFEGSETESKTEAKT